MTSIKDFNIEDFCSRFPFVHVADISGEKPKPHDYRKALDRMKRDLMNIGTVSDPDTKLLFQLFIQVAESWVEKDRRFESALEQLSSTTPIDSPYPQCSICHETAPHEHLTNDPVNHNEPLDFDGQPFPLPPPVLSQEKTDVPRTSNEKRKSPLEEQIGGDHYKRLAIQPVEYVYANKLGYFEGNAIKYITRHADKGKAEDIKKAIHWLQLLLTLIYGQH